MIWENLEQIRLYSRKVVLDAQLRSIEGRADLFIFLVYLLVEDLCEQNCRLIQDVATLFDADHVLGSVEPKYFTDILWIASCHKDQLKLEILGSILNNLIYLLRTDEFTVAKVVLKEQKVPV